MKALVYDCETTGTLPHRHCIHQLSGMIVIDNHITEKFDLKILPHEKADIDPEALKAGDVTLEQITAYPHRSIQYKAFIDILGRYVDFYNASDKFHLLGWNNAGFDDKFLRQYFLLEEDLSFNNYFFPNSIDVMSLASHYLAPDRHKMSSFKLKRVCLYLGIPVEESRLHEAGYDCELTYQVYQKVKGKTIDDDF